MIMVIMVINDAYHATCTYTCKHDKIHNVWLVCMYMTVHCTWMLTLSVHKHMYIQAGNDHDGVISN